MIEYVPRHYQGDFLNFMSQGGLRAFLVWHRRAGKNLTGFQWLISEALLKVGLYYYVFSSLKQAKKILWEGKTGDETEGQKFIDFIHPDWIWPNPRDGVNHSDMTVKLRNPQNRMKEGSMIQLVGTQSSGGKNEADHLRGTNPRGMILDEYSEQNPVVWETIFSPILKENKGWAVFTMTPKGPNHAFKMYNQIRHNPRWYVSVLDITQTYKANGEHIVTLQDIEEEREEGKDEAYIQQEYFCLDPSTRVLTADLTWVTLQQLHQHPQDLIGIDEYPQGKGRGSYRKFRRSHVLNSWETVKDCIQIGLQDGRVLIASHEHPWLVKRSGSNEWVETEKLKIGDTIISCGLTPWEQDTTREGGYLAGIYDGEGCVARRSVSFGQNPGPVLDFCINQLYQKGFNPFFTRSGLCQSVNTSLHESLRLLGTLRPLRLLQKAESIWNGASPIRGSQHAQIVSLTPLPNHPVIGISTSTQTFIAEGLITHNCSWAGVQKGSYYTHQIDMLYKDKRVVPGLYRPELDCITTWDIGHDDEMVVMVGQPHGVYTYWIDGFKIAQRDLKWAWGELQQWRQFKGYRYAAHYFPWDMGVHEWGASQGRLQSAQKLGMTNIHITPKMGVDEGRDAVRRDFQNWWFDERVSWAVGDLGMYSAAWDEKTGTFTDKDEKSTQKHTADCLRTYAISERVPSHDLIATLPTQCDMMIDPMERYGRPTNQIRNDRGMYHHDMGRVTDRYGFPYQGQVIPRIG